MNFFTPSCTSWFTFLSNHFKFSPEFFLNSSNANNNLLFKKRMLDALPNCLNYHTKLSAYWYALNKTKIKCYHYLKFLTVPSFRETLTRLYSSKLHQQIERAIFSISYMSFQCIFYFPYSKEIIEDFTHYLLYCPISTSERRKFWSSSWYKNHFDMIHVKLTI